jgi:hypothetical protein
MDLFNRKKQKQSHIGKAVVLLKTVREGILAEKAIMKQGYYVKKVAPPVEYRKGCEIAVEIDLDKKGEIEEILRDYGIESQGVIKL